MLREIVLDTETTGTEAKTDRLIEIGCIELLNHIPSGREFHRYINPQRAVSEGAFRVHGLSDAFLADKPLFAQILPDFLEFCGDATLVIHNAAFDVGFLNAEYARLGDKAPPRSSSPPSSTPWRSPAASIRARPTTSMRCARATASTIPAAPSTARSSIRRSWPRSISSCSAASRRRSG